ncbi:hypothetical protein CGRA01v4_13469 [Colletotrichum graminicola]|nr:hypothetical protein CGRA01v4_13469 [Colletotrichum graminicola]
MTLHRSSLSSFISIVTRKRDTLSAVVAGCSSPSPMPMFGQSAAVLDSPTALCLTVHQHTPRK